MFLSLSFTHIKQEGSVTLFGQGSFSPNANLFRLHAYLLIILLFFLVSNVTCEMNILTFCEMHLFYCQALNELSLMSVALKDSSQQAEVVSLCRQVTGRNRSLARRTIS